jgi:hypothetical protein
MQFIDKPLRMLVTAPRRSSLKKASTLFRLAAADWNERATIRMMF